MRVAKRILRSLYVVLHSINLTAVINLLIIIKLFKSECQ